MNYRQLLPGDWKLVLPHQYRTMAGNPGGTDGTPNKYGGAKTEAPELYNLSSDVSEQEDVSGENPEVMKRLLAIAETARAELGDKLTNKQGSGNREPGRLTDGERTALEKIHWPDGNPRKKKKK